MATVSCTTPELVPTECPPTPKGLAPEVHGVSESDESDAEDGRSGSSGSSNSERCVICLGKCKNRCYTDSCLHSFCFNCLLEWSRVKPECPLCKQLFKSIIHNVKSLKEYDEYQINPRLTSTNYTLPNEIHRINSRLNYTISNPPTYTYQTTMQVRPHQSSQIDQLFMQSTPATERFSQEFANDHIPFRQHVSEWRRYIYRRGIYALPLTDITNRSRECSVDFYRENPAQIHRLLPWVNRELNALLRNDTFQVQTIMNQLQELFTQHDISSPRFRQYFVTYLGERTDHFIHELLNFSQSPYDMMGYDRSVRYTPYYRSPQQARNVAPEVVISSGDESNSPQDLSCRSHNGRTEFTISTRSSHSTVIFRGSIEATIPTTQPGTSQQVSTDDGDIASQNQIALNSNGTVQITRNISLSSESSDECEFVLERKPPHLRTPEMVSLNSESDSDVVFVQEDQSNRSQVQPRVPDELAPLESLPCTEYTEDSHKNPIRRLRVLGFDEPSTSREVVSEVLPSTLSPAVERKPITLRILKHKLLRETHGSSSDDSSSSSYSSAIHKPRRKRAKKDPKSEPNDKKPSRLRSVIVKHDSKFYISKKDDSSCSSRSTRNSDETDVEFSSESNSHWTTTDGDSD